MPETTSSIPIAIRRRLSAFEQNVLIFGARGGVAMIKAEVPSIRSVEEAEGALERVKEKVAKLIADARSPEESNGHHRRAAPVIEDDVPQRERGPMLDRIPMSRPPRRTGPRRKKGEKLREALRVLAEEGPMKQSDLRRRIEVQAPEMAVLKKKLIEAGVTEGDLVDKSPMLHYDAPAPESPSEGAELQDGASELQSASEPEPEPERPSEATLTVPPVGGPPPPQFEPGTSVAGGEVDEELSAAVGAVRDASRLVREAAERFEQANETLLGILVARHHACRR